MTLSVPVRPLIALAGVFLVGSIGTAFYAVVSRAPSGAFLSLYFVGVAWAFAWWVLEDCRRLRIATSIDHGWFVFYTWPFAVPYHLLKTRGAVRGFAFIAALFALFVAAYGVGLALYFVLAALLL